MNSTWKTFDSAAEEEASLYVLELLPPAERRDFECRLQGDPSLRELVRDLQGNLDALALGDSVRPSPVHVWGRIVAKVNANDATVVAFRARMALWMPRLFAAAACLVLGALVHAWLGPSPQAPPVAAQDPTIPTIGPRPSVTVMPPPPSILPPTVPVPKVTAVAVRKGRTNVVTVPEMEHLRERVRVLASQVSALNQVLTQQVSLPSGFTRLHVFRLVNTNGLNPQRTGAETQALPEALAALAAGHRSAPTGIPENPAAGNPPPPTENPTTGPTELVASAAGLPLNGSQPLGFYDPETGRGAIALFDENLTENQNFVVWAQTTGTDGNPLLQDVGIMPAGDYPTVISFNAPANVQATPTFFVTLEPGGASAPAAPTGPVVAAPPPINP